MKGYSDIILIQDVIEADIVKIDETRFFKAVRINLEILSQDSNHPLHLKIQEDNLINAICSQYQKILLSSLPERAKHAVLEVEVDKYYSTFLFNGYREDIELSLRLDSNAILYIDKVGQNE